VEKPADTPGSEGRETVIVWTVLAVLAAVSVAVTCTVYVPGDEYACVEAVPVLVVPSPKFQL
jgi:hypothetical protein